MNPLWVSFLLLTPNTSALLEEEPEGQVERRMEPGEGKIRTGPRNCVTLWSILRSWELQRSERTKSTVLKAHRAADQNMDSQS